MTLWKEARLARIEVIETTIGSDRASWDALLERLAHGKWCVKSVADMQTCFLADGAPRKVEFDIELVHYG